MSRSDNDLQQEIESFCDACGRGDVEELRRILDKHHTHSDRRKMLMNGRSRENGCTPLMHAVTHNQRAVIVFLFKCETISSYGRMDTDIKDNNGHTAIEIAQRLGYIEIVDLLHYVHEPTKMFIPITILSADYYPGKTCYLDRLEHGDQYKFDNQNPPRETWAVDFKTLFHEASNGHILKVMMFEHGGRHSSRNFYKTTIDKQYSMTCGFMYAYDITKESSLSALLPLLDILKESSASTRPKILLGMRCDDERRRKIPYEEGRRFAIEHEMSHFFEVSAFTGINCREALDAIVIQAFDVKKQLEEERNGGGGAKKTVYTKPKELTPIDIVVQKMFDSLQDTSGKPATRENSGRNKSLSLKQEISNLKRFDNDEKQKICKELSVAKNGSTWLITALQSYQPVDLLMKMIREYKVDVNIVDKDGCLPIYHACRHLMYHDHLIMFLPITANMRSNKGKLSAITLSDSERTKMKTLLLGQTKLSIKLKNDTVFKILLQFAEEILNIDLVLATSGSSIDVIHDSLLAYCFQQSNVSALKSLLSIERVVCQRNVAGQTPLIYIVLHPQGYTHTTGRSVIHQELFQCLVDASKEFHMINAYDDSGKTALMIAATKADQFAVSTLCERGKARIDLHCKKNKNCIHYALDSTSDHLEVRKLLVTFLIHTSAEGMMDTMSSLVANKSTHPNQFYTNAAVLMQVILDAIHYVDAYYQPMWYTIIAILYQRCVESAMPVSLISHAAIERRRLISSVLERLPYFLAWSTVPGIVSSNSLAIKRVLLRRLFKLKWFYHLNGQKRVSRNSRDESVTVTDALRTRIQSENNALQQRLNHKWKELRRIRDSLPIVNIDKSNNWFKGWF